MGNFQGQNQKNQEKTEYNLVYSPDIELEAETCVIGSILQEPSLVQAVVDIVRPVDFRIEEAKLAFQSILDLYKDGKPINHVSVSQRAGKDMSKFLKNATYLTVTTANVESWATIVHDSAFRRAAIEIADRLNIRANNQFIDPMVSIAETRRLLEGLERFHTQNDLATPDELSDEFMEELQSNKSQYISTGVQELDSLLGGGLANSCFYVLAARPGIGKTTLALAIMDNIAVSEPVLFITLEMDTLQIQSKRISRLSGVPDIKIRNKRLNQAEYQLVYDASEQLRKYRATINKKSTATIDEIYTMAMKVKDLKLLIIDYFGLIRPSKNRESRVTEMTEISNSLKLLSRKLKIPILCLAQLNRDNQKRMSKVPQISDLRETGALEQDADATIFLHREDYYQEPTGNPVETTEMQVICAKSRFSPPSSCTLVFKPNISRIVRSGEKRNISDAILDTDTDLPF